MDKTTMEKPERRDRNFSIIVSHNNYMNLRKISVLADCSLGSTCRQLLEIISPALYARLKAKADSQQISVTQLCKTLLESSIK